MRNICMSISYDGTAYYGFQAQPGGNTVQDILEQAISKLTMEPIHLVYSGRTDAGVHAREQVINFRTTSNIPIERWCKALNTKLPNDILAWRAREVPLTFHSRKDATGKTYQYTIRNHVYADLFQGRTQLHIPIPLDVEAMRRALKTLAGEHDFTSFCSVKSNKASHIRNILDAQIETTTITDGMNDVNSHFTQMNKPQQLIKVVVSGNGFLRNMVRIIAGTLIQVGEGKRSSVEMQAILQAKNRMIAGPTAPPHGLILCEVRY